MSNLSREDIRAMGRAVDLELEEPLLTEVMHNLNALLTGMAAIHAEGLDEVEPLPIIVDQESGH